jgi:hypothetical protein
MTRNLFRALAALALTGLAWSGPALAEGDENGIRWTNGLTTNALRFNALLANPRANPRMVQVPLDSVTYALGTGDPLLRDQLEDPRARTFLEYVVSCALGPTDLVEWTDRAGNGYQWKGSIGLCPAWATGPASPECQRWVSACVLARNNALGHRVLLSARGYMPSNPSLFLPRPAVRTDPFQSPTEVRVNSTKACLGPTSGLRDCGWQLDLVGRCQYPSRVHLGGGGTPPDFCGTGAPLGTTLEGSNVLRVCNGLGACDASTALAQSDGSCGTQPPAVSFDCPPSETFSVLVGPVESGASGKMQLAAQNAAFPAPEGIAFPIREGAFYGTLFGAGALAPSVNIYVDANGVVQGGTPVVSGVIYQKMFSCRAPQWSGADAYATSRLCTMPGQNCVAHPLGACDAPVPTYGGPRCRRDNIVGLHEYGDCVGTTGDVYPQVVTPHLNAACDIVSDPAACAHPD